MTYLQRVSDYLNDPFYNNTFISKVIILPQALYYSLFNSHLYK